MKMISMDSVLIETAYYYNLVAHDIVAGRKSRVFTIDTCMFLAPTTRGDF